MMGHILVTGSEGLIGTALVESLENSGKFAVRFDIKFNQDNPNYGNILNLDNLMAKVKDCVGIVHLAGVSRVVWGEQEPDLCWQTNVIGTQNVIECAKQSSLKPWIVYASSREVYGQQTVFPVEIDAELAPMNIYARSKQAAEKLVLEARNFRLNTAVIRYSSVYGSVYDHSDRVVPAFCRAAVLGEDLKIEGITNTLDFTHVDDAVRGTLSVISLLNNNIQPPPIHLTTGVPTTLGELAHLACNMVGREVDFVEGRNRLYDVSRFWGSTSKTSQLLNWQPKIGLAEGIKNLVTQFKHFLRK